MLTSLLDAFEAIAEPGTIVELPFRWGQIEGHVLEDGEGGASEAFLIAREAAKHIAEAYEALQGGCRQYEENLRALLTRLERDPSSDPTMVRGVRQFLSWLEPLSDIVDKPLQEQVMWNTTRYFLLQYMDEGRFR